ncbi:rhomboid family intramembrane serine protease [Sandaracinus amylolyticus]|uniref:rhomboid family intramembrane serine protease n=1 Tax=Sandaracinus amylolyticus TaxID=927083 RepID=UPI001F236920|nr:rhomboid family intramembrane serine protease [Sandaracinus amylolyticus]UJR83795.1 Hypothetical protein I5071_58660 [Sandaracinus amylolyticus]
MSASRVLPIAVLAKRPITSGLAIAAIGVTIAWHVGVPIDVLAMTSDAIGREPWRLLTSALPHVGALHLIFNVYWLLALGSVIEGTCGARVMGPLVLTAAIGSAALEWALASGGVGLSGVVYGLIAFAWFARRRDASLAAAADPSTVRLFALWFVLCVVMTATGTMRVGNAAHAGGAILGALAGAAWGVTDARRRVWIAGTVVTTAAFVVLGSPLVRPLVNLGAIGYEIADRAYALVESDPARAIALYDEAIERDGSIANWHYNRGVALFLARRRDEALLAMERAHALDANDESFRAGLASTAAACGYEAVEQGRTAEAIARFERALAVAPEAAEADDWRLMIELARASVDGDPR